MEFNEMFEIKKASEISNGENKKVNVQKHVLWRVGILVIGIPFLFLLLYLIEGGYGLLGALYLSAFFFAAWTVVLIVEAIYLYFSKKNNLANANLLIIFVIAATIALILQEYV